MDDTTTSSPPPGVDAEPRDLPAWLWLGLPLASCLMVWLAPLLGYDGWSRYFMKPADNWTKEGGAIEILTLALLLPAIALGVLIFLRRRELPRRVGLCMLAVALGALFFAGEEASWGQHLLHFRPPESIQQSNTQQEFNLHNYEDWRRTVFSRLPRAAATTAMVAAMVFPLLLRRRNGDPAWWKSPWYWLMPTWRLIPACAVAVFSTIPAKLITRAYGEISKQSYVYMAIVKPAGEFKEYAVALAMLLYVASVYLRMNSLRKATAGPIA